MDEHRAEATPLVLAAAAPIAALFVLVFPAFATESLATESLAAESLAAESLAAESLAAEPLPKLGGELAATSVSGLSSGAFMAVQIEVAHSTQIVNPQGCWDWWGYAGLDYLGKDAPQIAANWVMAEQLAKAP